MADIPYPLINGNRHSSASVKIKMVGEEYVGFKSINYKDSLKRTAVKGFHPRKIGRTTGEEEASCDFEMYLAEWLRFQRALKAQATGPDGAGWKNVSFDIFSSYSESLLEDVIQDEIIGCVVDSVEAGLSSSAEATTRKIGCDVMYIRWNGEESLENPNQGASAQ